MSKYLYFNFHTETAIEFNCNDICEDKFHEDILRIGDLKNPINANELLSKLDDDEVDSLLIDLSYNPKMALEYFFIKDKSNQEYFLTIKDELIEKVVILGSNNDSIVAKLVGSTNGFLKASKGFFRKNLIKARR